MLRCLRFTTSGTRYYYHPDTRRYACPSSFFRCSRKRPSLLSLACASGRLSYAVGERYYCVYSLSAISFRIRTYTDASFHITIQAHTTNTRFTFVQSSTCGNEIQVRVRVRSSREYFQVRTYLVVPDFVLCVRLGQLIPHTEKYSSTLQVTRARDIRPPVETHASIFSHSIRLLLIAQSNDDAFHCSSCTILVDTTRIQTTTLLLRTMMR